MHHARHEGGTTALTINRTLRRGGRVLEALKRQERDRMQQVLFGRQRIVCNPRCCKAFSFRRQSEIGKLLHPEVGRLDIVPAFGPRFIAIA